MSIIMMIIYLQENMKGKYIEGMAAKFEAMSKLLEGKKFMLGEDVTIADFPMYDLIYLHQELDAGLVAKFPKITEYFQRMKAIPQLKPFDKGGEKHYSAVFAPTAAWGNK